MPLQTGRSADSYTVDAETQLKDAGLVATSAAAQVDSSDRILDFGNTVNSLEQIALTRGELVIDVSEIEGGDGDEAYEIHFQLSQSATFASGIFNRATVKMGDMTGSTAEDEYGTGRVYVGVDNEHKGVVYRYVRLYTQIAGTIATGIDYEAWLTCQA